MILSAKAKLAGVMGWPVTHSLWPRLHGFWLERYRIDGAYLPLPVAPEHFARALRGLADAGFCGVNLTLPHKQAGLAACHRVEPLAERIGAVNTVVFDDGRLEGRNTDAFGFLENLRQGAPAWDAAAGPALVLGAGGAARAAADLRALSGKRHSLATAVCVVRDGVRLWHHRESARLTMRPLDDAFIEAYLDAIGEGALASVGAYQLEGLGAQLFSRVEGDYFTILGLPLLPLLEFLRNHGVVAR